MAAKICLLLASLHSYHPSNLEKCSGGSGGNSEMGERHHLYTCMHVCMSHRLCLSGHKRSVGSWREKRSLPEICDAMSDMKKVGRMLVYF